MSIESEPQGIHKPKPRRRFGMREAAAAVMLAGAPEAIAQQPQFKTEQVQTDVAAEAKAALKKAQETYAGFRRILGNEDREQKQERIFKETESALDDPRYLEGLRKIKEYGGNLDNFVGWMSSDLVKNHAELESRLSRVPEILRGKIRIGAGDFEDASKMSDFSRNGFVEKALQFFDAGVTLNAYQLNGLLDVENDSPGISDAIFNLHRKSEGKIEAGDTIYYLRAKRLRADGLFDEAYVDGLVELSKAGIGLGYLVSERISTDSEKWARYLERVKDPKFREALIGFKAIGNTVYIEWAYEWKPEMYGHPLFLKNAALLQKYRSLMSFNLGDRSNTLKAEGLEEFLHTMSPVMSYDVSTFIEETAGDLSKWSAAQELAKKYQGNEKALKMILNLKGTRLTDTEYLAAFDESVRSAPTGLVSDFTAVFELDRRFVRQQTGKDIRDQVRNLNGYLATLDNPQTNVAVREILGRFRDLAFTAPILQMNELHDRTPNKRLEVLRTFNAKTLFEVMLAGGSDAYLSTFRLLYNGNGYTGAEVAHSFMSKVVNEYGSLYSYLQSTRPTHKRFGSFLELMSQNNILDQFLSDIGSPEQQREILTQLLFDPRGGLSKDQAVSLDDLLQTSSNESVRALVLDSLQQLLGDANADVRSKRVAGLLVAQYFLKTADVPQWAQEAVEANRKYFPDITSFNGDKAFKVEGNNATNTQLHFFYDDRGENKPESTWDGHHSFRNFIISLGGTVSWDKNGAIQRVSVGRGAEMTDEGDYLVIRKRDIRTNRMIVIYANKPDRKDETVAKVHTDLMEKQKPQVVVHRGHSYHASKTIRVLKPEIGLVNLGSCGGAKNISDVLEKAPSAQVMGTKAVGTMLVNDVALRAIDSMLLQTGKIDWSQLRTQLDRDFTQRGGVSLERWGSYVLPHQNRIAHLIAAIEAVSKEKR